MIVTALAPKIGYDNAKIVKQHIKMEYFKRRSFETNLISEKEYDKITINSND